MSEQTKLEEQNAESYEAVASDIDAFDFERATALMSVMEKVAAVAPKATSISGLAAAALEEMNQEAKTIAIKRAEAAQKAEAERVAAEAQRQADEAEANEPKAIPSSTFDSGDTDPDMKPRKESETDKIAKSNMRRA